MQAAPDPEDPRLVMARRILGRRLRDIRIQAELDLPAAADATGLTKQYLSDFERGRRLPNLPSLLAIADGYGILVTDILDGLYPFASRRRPRQMPDPPPDARRTR